MAQRVAAFTTTPNTSQAYIDLDTSNDWTYASRRLSCEGGNGLQLEAEAFAALVRGEPEHPSWPTLDEAADVTVTTRALLRSARQTTGEWL
jgi:predicted dehydrogenase